MPKYQDYPAAVSLDGTEDIVVVVDPTGTPVSKRATTAQIAGLAGAGALVATLAGSVAGNAYVFQLANSANYKAYRIILKGWNDAGQTYVWPVAFAVFANLLADTTPPSTLTIAHIVLAASGGVVDAVIDAVGA